MPTMPLEQITFGIEIECIANGSLLDTAQVLTDAGITAATSHYSGRNPAGVWLVKPDGSLNPGGREIVSPILSGTDGLQMVHTVATALARAGHVADRSCGFHVHVGARGMTGREVAAVFTRYAVMADEIMASLAPSRRHNHYCGVPNGAAVALLFNGIAADADPRRVMYAVNQTSRYAAVNLMNMQRGTDTGTIEFRQHQGTVDADRMVAWIKFVRGFVVESARVANAPAEVVTTAAPRGNPFVKRQSQQARLWDEFASGATLTGEHIARFLGTTEARAVGQINNMRRNAASHGAPCEILVRRGRRGAPTTYQMTNATNGATTNTRRVVWGDMFDGIDADVAAYMTARAHYFATRGTTARAA